MDDREGERRFFIIIIRKLYSPVIKNMKNIIGMELAYNTSNYGAQLQAFATQQTVKQLGMETRIISLSKTSFLDFHNIGPGIIKSVILTLIARNKRKKTRIDISDEDYINNRIKRKEAANAFIEQKLTDIIGFPSCRLLSKEASKWSAVLIGSDQKWLPGACYGKVASLSFAPKGVRRISYATSLGVSDYPRYCWHMSRKMWNNIDFLSVREEQGASIIRQICGNLPVEVVVDPTYLLTKEEWQALIPTEKKLNERYILCYFLGNDDDSKRCAKRYSEKYGLKLVSIMSDESFSPYDKEYADILVQGERPEGFINWIRGAEVVFTDSFHGTAFSVINEKQFFVFYRKRLDAKQSRNSRIDNILSKWNLKERLILDKELNWDLTPPEVIDYAKVNSILSNERRHSLMFLNKALHFDEDK